jgi:hypothetical protein
MNHLDWPKALQEGRHSVSDLRPATPYHQAVDRSVPSPTRCRRLRNRVGCRVAEATAVLVDHGADLPPECLIRCAQRSSYDEHIARSSW